MFEQDRYPENERSKGMFRGNNPPGQGMSRYQVSGVGDSAEVAADRAADQAVGGLFRSADGGTSAGFQADLSDSDLGGGGSPLPEGLVGSMEQSLGGSFAGVRVHTDAGADRASRQIDARAFTRGQDIYFSSGSYDPGSQEGQHLIAHELAHVAAGDTGIHRDPAGSGGSAPAAAPASPTPAQPAPAPQPAAPKNPELEKRDKAKQELEVAIGTGNTKLGEANDLVQRGGSLQGILAEVRGGATSQTMKDSIKKSSDLKGELGTNASTLEQKAQAYIDAESRLNGQQGSLSGAALCAKARTLAGDLKAKEPQLEAARQVFQFGLEQAQIREERAGGGGTQGGAQGTDLSAPVKRMLSDRACDQFFKAVGEVRAGAGMGGDLSAAEAGGFNHTDAKHLREDVGTEKLDRASRGLATSGVVLGALGAGVSAVDQGAGYDEELHENRGEEVNAHSDRTGTAASHMGATVDTLSAVNDLASTGVEAAQLGMQETARRKKLRAMGANGNTAAQKMSSANHVGRTAVVGSTLSAFGSGVGAGNSIYGTTTGSDDKTKNMIEERNGNIASITADTLSVSGDLLGLSADSRQADKMKKQDTATKASMQAIGKQLEKLKNSTTDNNLSDEQKAMAGQICGRLGKRRFNKETPSLKALINQLLGSLTSGGQSSSTANASGTGSSAGGQNAAAANTSSGQSSGVAGKIKPLLVSLLAMETSRAATKDAVSGARWDTAFDVLGSLGDMTSLASSVTGFLGAGMASLILNTVSSFIGLIGTGWDAKKAFDDNGSRGQASRNEERDLKVNACRDAVKQMVGLPPLSLEELQLAQQEKLALPESKVESAEQYAAVFSIVKAANVDMVDFLYAIHMGGFGQQVTAATDQEKTAALQGKFQNMYRHLNFE